MSPTWNTTTDWDSATQESGVVHENTSNTDFSAGSYVWKGYPAANPMFSSSLLNYYPLHEDSGTTAYDFSGNGNDGTGTNTSNNEQGILNTSAWWFRPSNNSRITIPIPTHTNTISVGAWVYVNSYANNTSPRIISTRNHGAEWDLRINTGGQTDNLLRFGVWASGSLSPTQHSARGTTHVSPGSWYFTGGSFDGSNVRVWLDAVNEASASGSGIVDNATSAEIGVGSTGWSNPGWFDGRICNAFVMDRALSQSEWQRLYDVVANPSSLTAAEKVL